jgi:hypothetical protein
MQGMTMGALSVSELMELQQLQAKKAQGGQFTSAQSSRYTYLTTQYHSSPTTSKAPTAKPSDAATTSSVVAAPSGPAVPVWRADGAEVVPQGRDGQTYFRSLGFSSGDARRLAEHASAYPNQRGERRRMMDRFGAPMERRMNRQASRGGGGGGFDASGVARGVGDLFGGLFGRREQTQAADYGGGGQVAAEPARQGMSPLLIGGLAVAGLGAAYFLTQA